jgi:hypothetical protein
MGTAYVMRENHTSLFNTFYSFKDFALISEFLLVLSRFNNCTSTGELPHKLGRRATFDFLRTVAVKLIVFWDVMPIYMLTFRRNLLPT